MGLFHKKKEEKSCCCGDSCTPEKMAQAEAAKTTAGVKVLGSGCAKCHAMEDAAKAAQLLKTSYVIPIHYNTWPVIEQEPRNFKAYAESIARCFVKIVEPGHSLDLEYMHK